MRKKLRGNNGPVYDHAATDLFDTLPDDIVLVVLCKLSSTSSSPSDFIAVHLTCKRLNKLGVNPLVLKESCKKSLAVRAKNWCDGAHRYLKLCVKADNTEAYYTLGMIRFYCLQNRGSGASLMAKAAIRSHATALYSLAVIQFNGSGGIKNDKDLHAGVALCCRSAYLGHVDALRELGHCLQDGYGVRKNVTEGRRLLVQANAREITNIFRLKERHSLDYFSLFELHPVNKFLIEWFGLSVNKLDEGLRMCSYKECGRPETRKNEFRKCSGCGKVNYCSRGCQAHDWRVCHKVECAPMEEWVGHAIDDVGVDEI
ncbi:F-box domain, cyclin-like protein [Tanacetum coccineum]